MHREFMLDAVHSGVEFCCAGDFVPAVVSTLERLEGSLRTACVRDVRRYPAKVLVEERRKICRLARAGIADHLNPEVLCVTFNGAVAQRTHRNKIAPSVEDRRREELSA